MIRHRRSSAAAALLGLLALVSCSGDDESGSAPTVLVGAPGTDAGSTPSGEQSDEDDSEEVSEDDSDGGVPADTRDYPSRDEVGRASFTHTIVAGDFLRSIADRYEVEIDDIVGANEWDDGRDHLLLPDDVIYLPADAVDDPPGTEADQSEVTFDAGGDDDAIAALDAAADRVCANGQMTASIELTAAQADAVTLEVVADRIDVAASALHQVNDPFPRPAGMPWPIAVPCVGNWPQGVTFYDIIDGPICSDGSSIGEYEARSGDDGESIASSLGVSVEQLTGTNDADLASLSTGQRVVVCASWFE